MELPTSNPPNSNPLALPRSLPTRFCLRVRVQEIPGPPLGRSLTLAKAFLQTKFGRPFSWETDYVYTPYGIEGEGKQWVLVDPDSRGAGAGAKVDVEDVRVVVLRVKRRVVGGGNVIFDYEEVYYSGIRTYTAMFPWGGRPLALDRRGGKVVGGAEGCGGEEDGLPRVAVVGEGIVAGQVAGEAKVQGGEGGANGEAETT